MHEVIQHRWFSSQRAGQDVGLDWAALDYVDQFLRDAPDEAAVLGPPPGSAPPDELPDVEDDEFDSSA